MVKSNSDVRKAASELYHRLFETKEITVQEAKTGAQILSVIQKSFMIDILKERTQIHELPSEDLGEITKKPYIKRINDYREA